MLRKQLATAIGISSLLVCGSASAQAFNLSELIQLGSSLPELGDSVSNADLESSSGTITLNDGSNVTIATSDGSSLRNALQSNNTTLLANGNQVTLGTSATSLESAYVNSNQSATFNVTSIVDSRPVTLEWEGPLDAVTQDSTFNARLNGQAVTFELPPGTSLADFNGNTQFRLLDADGNVLIDGNLNNISASQINEIASKLGILNADMALRGAQKQFMAQSFGIISNQIDSAMQPNLSGSRMGGGASSDLGYNRGRGNGLNVWVASEIGDLSGQAGNTEYDGNSKAAMVGIDQKVGNFLAGITAGYNKVEITSKSTNNARADLSGNFLAPYGAVSLFNDSLVLDGILLYQDLEGNFSNSFNEVDLDGDRLGARASGTYFLPEFSNVRTGLTAGGAYMKDDLDGTTLGTTNDYGIELGEAFAGIKMSSAFATGRVYGSVMYYEDITTEVDSSADVLESDDDNRTELQVGVSHRLGRNMDFNISARTTVGSSDTEYTAVQAAMVYPF